MNLRVGILTLHLHVNYGGIIQAAALYRFLRDNGCDPILLRKEPEHGKLGNLIRAALRRLPGQDIRRVRSNERARARHYGFINQFLPDRTAPLQNARQIARVVEDRKLDAVIVGSDQVWRLEYHQDDNSMVYFLDFVKSAIVKRISYAASFGTSDWQHTDKKERVAELMSCFDAVSVREQSGVRICNETFGRMDCQLVLDPTLLVDPIFYVEVTAPALPGAKTTILTYLLDHSEKRLEICELVKTELGAHHQLMAISPYGSDEKVSIPEWLRAFTSADFVVTDSYHGTIFAILSRKNFIAIGNSKRGLDRFSTLLGSLGLEDRLVMDDQVERTSDLATKPIDFDQVNNRIESLRLQSRDFLLAALGKSVLQKP